MLIRADRLVTASEVYEPVTAASAFWKSRQVIVVSTAPLMYLAAQVRSGSRALARRSRSMQSEVLSNTAWVSSNDSW